jgi:hypothetical protein
MMGSVEPLPTPQLLWTGPSFLPPFARGARGGGVTQPVGFEARHDHARLRAAREPWGRAAFSSRSNTRLRILSSKMGNAAL